MGSTGLTLADLPNIFIMIGALVALFAMLVILLRNMEFIGIVGEGRHHDAWAMQPPRLLMQRVHIPFTFKLEENHSIGYSSNSSGPTLRQPRKRAEHSPSAARILKKVQYTTPILPSTIPDNILLATQNLVDI